MDKTDHKMDKIDHKLSIGDIIYMPSDKSIGVVVEYICVRYRNDRKVWCYNIDWTNMNYLVDHNIKETDEAIGETLLLLSPPK